MIRFDIKNRFTGDVQFTAEIDCSDDAPLSLKIGLAVKWGLKTRANLSRADLSSANLYCADFSSADLSGADLSSANLSETNLSSANLSETNLSRANLSSANLIDGGQRSDGYRFVGWTKNGVLQIRAGCRNFTITEARAHWASTRANTPLGDETTCILDHIEAVARIRGLA